jgi:uncharacterized protein with NRDE domain
VCTLATLRGVSRRWPLVVAANRDERYARATAPPERLDDAHTIVAGRDLEAGGTWLGCRTQDGGVLVAGLLNRRTVDGGASLPGELSRGALCLDMLRARSVDEALVRLAHHDVARYGSFNLLLADFERAVVAHNTGALVVAELAPGLSLLTNLDLNDPRCPRLASAVPAFEAVARRLRDDPPAADVVDLVRPAMASHHNSLDPADASPFSRVCVHTETYGTRSSTIVLAAPGGEARFFHASGPPCRTPFAEV